MFEKNLKLAYLLDFYGDVLDEHTRSIMDAYYEDDLSLAEIADGLGISRQGVRHVIKRGEEQLEFLESRLGLSERHLELERTASELKLIAEKLTHDASEEISASGARLLELAEQISSKDGED